MDVKIANSHNWEPADIGSVYWFPPPMSPSSHPMFLRRLSSLSSSFPPCSLPALSQARFKSNTDSSASSFLPQFIPTPHPWWSVPGFPPWPSRLPHSHPSALESFTHRALHPLNINLGDFGACRSFHTSADHLMEFPDRDRGPPYKRRKSGEERKEQNKEKEGPRGGATEGKEGGSKREHHHLDSRKDGSLRSSHHFNDGTKDRVKNNVGKDVRGETSRDKNVERTKSETKDRQRRESADRDHHHYHRHHHHHQQEGHKESQPVMHKPNQWFKGRGSQELDGPHRDTKGTSEQQRDGCSDGGQPRSTTCPSNLGQVPGGNTQPSPPRRAVKCESFC